MTNLTTLADPSRAPGRTTRFGAVAEALILAGLSSAYIQGAVTKLLDFDGALQEMAHFGLQPAPLFAVGVIAFELTASALVISGFQRRAAAYALAAFTLAATLIALRFWTMPAGPARAGATNAFFEHIGLVAAFLFVARIETTRQTSKKST